MHVHGESEHLINGQHTPMEAHFVHTHEDGSVLVVGVSVVEGGVSHPLLEMMNDMPETIENAFNPYDMVPGTSFFEYSGSFTTPPCTEGVQWIFSSGSVSADS